MNSIGLCSFIIFLTFHFIHHIEANAGDSCKTPNDEAATCISIHSCEVLLASVRNRDTESINFLRDSQCGGYNSEPLVCCGTSTTYKTPTPIPPRTVRPNISRRFNGISSSISNRDVCGYQSSEDRILSGIQTEIDEFPWMALLGYTRKSDGSGTFACAGSLIGPRYILTAAHCVTGKINEKLKLASIRLGEWNTDTDEDCVNKGSRYRDCSDPPINVGFEEVIPHPDYNDRLRDKLHDIALIRLNQDITFTDFVRPICLPTINDQSSPGKKVHVAGWGRTESGRPSAVKLKLQVPIDTQDHCRSLFKTSGINIQDSQVCAGGEKGKDSCTGDSGGPLMTTFQSNVAQWYIEGIVSFGTTCGTARWPGVYTKVSNYVDWINDNVR